MSLAQENAARPTPEEPSDGEYGFGGRLSREFPSQIVIDSTELCNLACTHCVHPHFKKSEFYSGKCLDPELNHKAVDEVATSGKGVCQYLRYTGEGEPLLHPQIFEMITYAVQNSGTTITITTNASIRRAKKLEMLMATGVDVIDVSIDAYSPETYASIRVNGDLNVTRENVLRLIDMSKAPGCGTKVVVSYIEQPQNRHETADFERFWRDQGADYVVVRRLHTNAGAFVEVADSSPQARTPELRRPCLYPWERIVLNPRGSLSFCPVDWVQGSVLADYRTTTITETWQGPSYARLRQAHLTNGFSGFAICDQCPDWKLTRWPAQGRSYADMVQDFKNRE